MNLVKGKRALSLFLCGALLLGQLGVTVLAEGSPEPDGGPQKKTTTACICDTHCAADSLNEDCPVCAVEGADLSTACKPVQPDVEPDPEPTVQTVTHWEWVDEGGVLAGNTLTIPATGAEDPVWEMVASWLPTAITATVDGEADPVTLALGAWSCEGYDPATPGSYTAVTSLAGEGYTLAADTTPLAVTVELLGAENGGVNLLAVNTVTAGDFKLTSGSGLTEGTDYTYSNNTLTIKSSTPTTISMADGVTQTSQDHILVQNGVTANITLDNVVIQPPDWPEPQNGAIEVLGNGVLNLTIKGTNSLFGYCGIYVPMIPADVNAGTVATVATLKINGGATDSLTAQGKQYSAGIGGRSNSACGTVTIEGGIINAIGGDSGAGIGGENFGGCGTVTITGGTVTATSSNAAGIGGGKNGSGGNVVISGGTVTAISDSGAGIGRGINGAAAHGTFSTSTDGTTGSAFIIASSIGNKTNQNNWSGIIFEGNSGKVYGDQTLSADLTIPNGNSLEIPQGSSLTIPEGVTLTNNGTLTGTGTISPDSYKLTAEITGLSDRTETYNGGPFTPRYTYTGNDNSKVFVKWYADNGGSKGSQLDVAPTDAGSYYVGVSAAASGIYKAVDEQTAKFIITIATQAAPTAAPKEDAIGTDRIKLQTVAASAASGAAAEYSKDGGATWQASPEFGGLSAGTSYTFTVRYAATGNYAASPAGPTATISTKPKQDGGSSTSGSSPSSSSTGSSSTGSSSTGSSSTGGSSTGGSSTGGGITSGSTSNTLNTPVLREILISDPGRGGSVTIPSQRVIHALNTAKKAAERSGSRTSDIVLAAKLPGGTTKVTLEQSALRRLASSGIGSLKLDFGGAVTMTFDHSALEQIVRQTSGAVTFAADKATVTGKALAAIGSRPAYDLTISYQRSGQTVKLPSVGGVAVALFYTPAPSERDGALYAVYADGGKAVWLDKSSYDEDAKAVLFTAEHFSVYGVGYKAPPAFTDTVGHWAS